MSGETTVGSIVGALRIDADQFHRELERAILETEQLDGKNVDVNVRADAAPVERLSRAVRDSSTSMDASASSGRRLNDAIDKVALADQKLIDIKSRGNATASQEIAASQALARARRAEQDAIFATYDSNLRLHDSNRQVAASNDLVDESNKKVGRSSRDAGQGMGALGTAIIGLGPTIVPLAAGATALAVGFAGMGAAGVLAIVGVRREMEAGTAVGATYGRNLGILNQNLTDLSRIAATNVLGSFQGAVADLQTKMPTLTSMVGEFSSMTGRTAAALTSGLVAGFITLEPLMRDAGVYVQTLAQRFQAMMTGSGLTSFGDYIRSVFPQVMTNLEHVVELAGRLVVAFAPLGGGVLSMLGSFAAAINAIPIPVLTALATLGPAVFLGFRTWQALAPLVEGFDARLGRVLQVERVGGLIVGR